MLIATISVSLGGSILLCILFLLILLGLTIIFYRHTLPPLPTARRLTLSALRSLALTLLLLVVFEPVVRIVHGTTQRPVLAVLIDESQSMTIKDGSGDRAAQTRNLLQRNPFRPLPGDAAVEYYTFSSKVSEKPAASPDSLAFGGELTNIADALAGMKDQLARENIQAVAMISDGDYTAGRNPLYDAEALGIPVFTVGVGDTSDQKDILVENVFTNSIAYADTRLPIDAVIKSSGYGGENVTVTVSEGNRVLDTKLVALREGTREYPVRLFAEPKEEGVKKYTVSVSKLAGEITEKNNQRSVYVKVLKSKLRVLLVAGAPNPDVAAVRQALAEDEHLTVRAFVQKKDGDYYEGRIGAVALDSTDCIVLVGFPSSSSTPAAIGEISTAIDGKNKPVLFVNAKTTDYSKLRTIERILPFTWEGVSTAEIAAFPAVPDRQKSHPLVTLEGSMTAEGWQQLPPIYLTQTQFRAKPEADVIASAKIQNVIVSEPLIAIRNISRQKSFAITGAAIWRWRLLAQDNVQTERFFTLLMTNAIKWLTTEEDQKNVRVVPAEEAFTTAEAAAFTGQVYDEELQPVDGARVTVELSHGAEKFQMALTGVGNGRYEGSIDGLGEGEYTYTAKASSDTRTYGEDKGRFSVGQMNVEFIETKMNNQLLEQVASRTGGKYYDVATANGIAVDLGKDVKFSAREITQASEIEIWNWKYIAAAVILLFAVEWFLRKRSGML